MPDVLLTHLASGPAGVGAPAASRPHLLARPFAVPRASGSRPRDVQHRPRLARRPRKPTQGAPAAHLAGKRWRRALRPNVLALNRTPVRDGASAV